jgi:hypothetical protein
VSATEGVLVAKKKADAKADRHQSGFLVRLPEAFRGPLDELKAKHRRAITTEVQIALEKHFRDEGIKFTPEAKS